MLSTGELWPNPMQSLLLQVIAAPDEAARAAFQVWCAKADFEHDFDPGTRRLLPLVYDRAQQLGATSPLMGRLKGTYRRAWYDTNTVLHATAPVVATLVQRGFDTLMLKGVPLGITYYSKPALRPMADIDVVVPTAQAHAAIALLRDAGWTPGPTARDEDVDFRHSMQLVDADGHEADIHWHCLFEACSAEADAHFWRTAEPLTFAGINTRQLDATNTLLHTIIHGLRWNREPPIRWIPDSLVVLRAAESRIDWSRLVEFARSQKLTHRLSLGLDYLARQHAAPVPQAALRALRTTRVGWTERIENSVVLRDSDRMFAHPLTKQWVIFADYLRIARERRPLRFAIGLSHYTRYRWRLRGRREILTQVLHGLRRRMFGLPS